MGVTGLAPHRDKRVSALSGGQLRRLSLGLELTLDPPCMVCDEVTSGLDPQSEDQILALLRDLAETNHKSFVCIIHNLGKLNQFDWVTVVYQGDVVFQGSPDALLGYFGIPDGLRLYDLDAEIGEQTDVAAQHPEIVAKLKALADKMSAEIGGKEPTARRPAGEVKGAKTLYPTVDYVPNDVKKDDAKKPASKKGAAKAAAMTSRALPTYMSTATSIEKSWLTGSATLYTCSRMPW